METSIKFFVSVQFRNNDFVAQSRKPYLSISICITVIDPIAEHNEKLLAMADTRDNCLCEIKEKCNRCDNKYTFHDHVLRHNCKAKIHWAIQGSTCLNEKCRGAKLFASSWCARCFTAYKTSKRITVLPGELTPQPRKWYKKERLWLANKAIPAIIYRIAEPDEFIFSEIIASYAGFINKY